MVQIARTALNPEQPFYIALQKIFGIGRATGLAVSEACGISKEMLVKDIKEPYVQKVAVYIQDHHVVGDELKRSVRDNILTAMGIKSWQGRRHELGLPLRSKTHQNQTTSKKLRHHIMYDTSK